MIEPDKKNKLLPTEKTAIFSIASLFALRMIGLFMIIPIFSLYAPTLAGSTPLLIGVALGCYGLSQAALQMPFGFWSDKWGRKPLIALGLGVFILGSAVAAMSHGIWAMILGRTLQGAGAIGSASSALLADLTRDEHRTKAMAGLGITIGTSFLVAMMLGPLFASKFSIPTLFWISAAFGIIALVILYSWVPKTTQSSLHLPPISIFSLAAVLLNPELRRLNYHIFILHAIFTAAFIAIPVLLKNVGLDEQTSWHVYIPVLLLAFTAVFPLIRRHEKNALLVAIGGLAIAFLLILTLKHFTLGIAISLWLFFTTFTWLEALLPSMVSKIAPSSLRGTAIGVFSSCQFFGIFMGGLIGGWLYEHFQVNAILYGCAALTLLWLIQHYRASRLLNFNSIVNCSTLIR